MDTFIDVLSAPFRRETKIYLNKWTLPDFLEACVKDPRLTASSAERLFKAIRPGVKLDTGAKSADPRLAEIFEQWTIMLYPDFEDFYGLEPVVEKVVRHYELAAQGAEAGKKIVLLVGPSGSAKSMLARRLKNIFGRTSMFVLAVKKEGESEGYDISPVFEHPLDLFDREQHELKEAFAGRGIKAHLLGACGPSPWAWRHLDRFGGNFNDFFVLEVPCSVGKQQGIARIEARGEGELDGTALTGLRREDGSYDYCGALNRGASFVEFVEIFKAPQSALRPLQTAMDEGCYAADGGTGPIPYRGQIIAHCNEPEFERAKNDPVYRSFMERLVVIEVPLGLRMTEEEQIYDTKIVESPLANHPRAPHTTKVLARLTTISRVHLDTDTPTLEMGDIHDGRTPLNGHDKKPNGAIVAMSASASTDSTPTKKPSPLQDLRQRAKREQGRKGITTRGGFQILSEAFTGDPDAQVLSVDPLLVLERAESYIRQEFRTDDTLMRRYLAHVKAIRDEYLEQDLEPDIKNAYAKARGGDPPQVRFNRYAFFADLWSEDKTYKDPETGHLWGREEMGLKLGEFEKKVGVADPRELREEVVMHCLRYREARGAGAEVPWNTLESMRLLIEKEVFLGGDDLGSVIGPGKKRSAKLQDKHDTFIAAMGAAGYSLRQTHRLVAWYMDERKIPILAPE
jgi:serine protein kinase